MLLVGESYGDGVSEHNGRSYTHLEYRRALSDPSKTILPFLIGSSYQTRIKQRTLDDRLLGFIHEIQRHHTASCLERDLGTDLVASTIFEHVLRRLFELYSDSEASEGDSAAEATESAWEKSPIKQDELERVPALSPEFKASEQPVRVLARNHTREALAALRLRLPQIAVHHLRQAVALIPMDIVSTYWFARLQIATGRRKECIDGRRAVLGCVQLASKLGEGNELASMASYILAVRASERLGDAELALEYARAAHEQIGYHWLAKLEYGRQLAAAGRSSEALDLARETFWLRPDSYRRLVADPSFQALGKKFNDFCAGLKDELRFDVGTLAKLEGGIREFASTVGVESAGAPPPTSEEAGSVLELVSRGCRLARCGLDLLQASARKLVELADSFAYFEWRGLNAETLPRLVALADSANADAARLGNDDQQMKVALKECQNSLFNTRVVLFALGAVVLLLGVVSILAGYNSLGFLVMAILVFGGMAASAHVQALQSTCSESFKTAERATREHQSAIQVSDAIAEAMRLFTQVNEHLTHKTREFVDLVDAFEAGAARRQAFAPAVPLERQSKNDLVRIDLNKASASGCAVDVNLLPARLRFVIESSPPKAKFWLARRVRSEGVDSLTRSSAYFG